MEILNVYSTPSGVFEVTLSNEQEVLVAPNSGGWVAELLRRYVTEGGTVLPKPKAPLTSTDVNIERDRRILAGKTFTLSSGPVVAVAGDETTTRNLQALALAAQARMAVGDTTVTLYKDENNVIHSLDPSQVFELWAQGSGYVSAVFQASWPLKDNPEGIPEDYQEDYHWPS